MDRQGLLNTTIEKLNGNGRSTILGTSGVHKETYHRCVYVPNGDHPGCAIGCHITDPALRARISAWEQSNPHPNNTGVSALLGEFPEVIPFLIQDDEEFLCGLQALHDKPMNWTNGLHLDPNVVRRFAKQWNLTSPL